MSEPLTKDKIFTDCGIYDCDMHKAVYLVDLKSALEEFEKLIKLWSTSEIVYCRVKDDLKKSFPALYEPTNKGSEVEKEKGWFG